MCHTEVKSISNTLIQNSHWSHETYNPGRGRLQTHNNVQGKSKVHIFKL